MKFLQWGHTSVSRRFLDAAIRFLTETSSSGNLNSLAVVRAPRGSCETGGLSAAGAPMACCCSGAALLFSERSLNAALAFR